MKTFILIFAGVLGTLSLLLIILPDNIHINPRPKLAHLKSTFLQCKRKLMHKQQPHTTKKKIDITPLDKVSVYGFMEFRLYDYWDFVFWHMFHLGWISWKDAYKYHLDYRLNKEIEFPTTVCPLKNIETITFTVVENMLMCISIRLKAESMQDMDELKHSLYITLRDRYGMPKIYGDYCSFSDNNEEGRHITLNDDTLDIVG